MAKPANPFRAKVKMAADAPSLPREEKTERQHTKKRPEKAKKGDRK